MSAAKKILIATPLYPPDDGGPATYARLIESELPKHGFEVTLLSYSNFRQHKKGLSHLRYAYSLWKAAKHVDLIYTLDLVSVGLPALIISKLQHKPLLLRMVGDYAWEQGTQRFGVQENLDQFILRTDYPFRVRLFRFIQTLVAKQAVRTIVPSEYLKGIVVSWGIAPEKISVIYNAFNADLPSESKQELRTMLSYKDPTIITAGRMVPWKGFKVLMDAALPLVESFPNLNLAIAGSGDASEYVAYAKSKQYSYVSFLGLVEHDELMKRIKAADCFVLNTGYEGLSHLLLEAMAVGTPIVTTDVGGNTELFKESGRGVLVPYNDTQALTDAVKKVCTDEASATKMATSARSFVLGFTEDRLISSLTEELHRIMK